MFSKILLATVSIAALTSAAPTNLVARANTGDVTFYTPGLGSCGITSGPNELVAAAPAGIFDTFPGAGANPNLNPICKKKARVTANGKSVDVTIVDRCPGCVGGSIDLSPAAFTKLAPESVGRIKGATWTFI
ncbi:plant expansin [Marasmius fiardii PR-910]|nr:plant expansin [Marasmius fiardii PR-910]